MTWHHKREREQDGQTPWSGFKSRQWQSDVPLNRITLKVSCHHIPASHYQGHGSLWDDRERLGFPAFLWTRLEHPPVMPDGRRRRERTDEALLVPWRWRLGTWEPNGVYMRTVAVNKGRLLPQSQSGIPTCLTTGESWQSPPQAGQRDEDRIPYIPVRKLSWTISLNKSSWLGVWHDHNF